MKLYNPNNGQTIQIGIYKQAETIVKLMQLGWIAETTGDVSPLEVSTLKPGKKKGYKPQTEITIMSVEETDQKPESEMTNDPNQQNGTEQHSKTETIYKPDVAYFNPEQSETED